MFFLHKNYGVLFLCNHFSVCRINFFPLLILFYLNIGLYGANNREALDIDIVCEILEDLVTPLIGMFGEKDEEKKVSCSLLILMIGLIHSTVIFSKMITTTFI